MYHTNGEEMLLEYTDLPDVQDLKELQWTWKPFE